tara:strand:- start:377 stop:583 length:207 start_codon:yes stop_codon:yes gene_type:complete
MATVTENFINSIEVTENVRRDSSFITLTFLGKTPYTKKDVEFNVYLTTNEPVTFKQLLKRGGKIKNNS